MSDLSFDTGKYGDYLNPQDECIYPQPAPSYAECFVSSDPARDANLVSLIKLAERDRAEFRAALEAEPKENRKVRRDLKAAIAKATAEIERLNGERPAKYVDEGKAVDFILNLYAPLEANYQSAVEAYKLRIDKSGPLGAATYLEDAIRAEVERRELLAELTVIQEYITEGRTIANVIRALDYVKGRAFERVIRAAGGSRYSGNLNRAADDEEIKMLAERYNQWHWNDARSMAEAFNRWMIETPAPVAENVILTPATAGGPVMLD